MGGDPDALIAPATDAGNRRAARSYSRELLVLTANADSDRPAVITAKRIVGGTSQ